MMSIFSFDVALLSTLLIIKWPRSNASEHDDRKCLLCTQFVLGLNCMYRIIEHEIDKSILMAKDQLIHKCFLYVITFSSFCS